MQQQLSLEVFLRYNGLTYDNDIQQSLTHSTYKHENNNSKYVFLGMYAFKGRLSEWVFQYIQGSGKQLQHYLGNISGSEYMGQLFDYLNLEKYIRYGEGCKPNEQKHVFMYGLLGCIFQKLNSTQINKLLYRFFIAPNDNHLPHTHYINDPWQKLLFICKQQQFARPVRTITKNAEKIYVCAVLIDGLFSISHESKSYIYVQKKATQKALKQVVAHLSQQLQQSEAHINVLKIVGEKTVEQRRADRERRIKAFELKQAEKKAAKLIRQAMEDKKKALEDQKRKLAKKKSQGKNQKKQSVYREYSAADVANMSSGKRRRLEDLGIITKK